jgi:TPR repeat protein
VLPGYNYSSAGSSSAYADSYNNGTHDLQASMNSMSLSNSSATPPASIAPTQQGPNGQRGSTSSVSSSGALATQAAMRANANAASYHANQEIYSSAAEVEPQNSLAAIADSVDGAAKAIKQGDVSNGELGLKNVQGDANVAHAPPAAAAAAAAGTNSGQGNAGAAWQYETGFAGHSEEQAAHSQAYAPHQQRQQSYNQDDSAGSLRPTASADGGYFGGHDSGAAGAGYAASQAGSSAGYNHSNPAGMYPGSADQAAHAAYYAQYAQMYHDPSQQQQAAGGQVPVGNPYFAAAQGYLGYPDASGGYAGGYAPGMPALARQGTHLSMASSSNSAAQQRKKRQDSVTAQQQTLPFNKEFVDEYRHRMKAEPDPEAQFAFAKYLIEAAKKVNDPKQQRKYRDALLSESLKLIKRLATTGMDLGKPPYAEAQFFLANCFGNGSLGLQVDHEKAYNLYVQASKQNHPAATYRTAVCNEVGAGTKRDHHRAVLFYRKASALGDTAGMYKLGMIMLNGLLGQQRNPREAVVWLKRAAGQADDENPHALHELGLLHEKANNNVVMHDEAYARELFTQAAQLGYAPSQFKLGSAYEYGALTCPVDPRRSIAWYTKAAGKNDGESELALSGWYLTGSEGVLKQSDSEAYLWARRAAVKGIPKAEYAVGYYSEVGIGVAADVEEAKRWYMRAAGELQKSASCFLISCLPSGCSSLSQHKEINARCSG